jgi:hypothetical protein
MKQILLNKARGKETINVENSISVDFSTKQRLITDGYSKGTIDYYETYVDERDNTNTYKMFFTIKPYMTNVLFNAFTEIVVNDGAVDCFCLGDKKISKTGDWNRGVRNKGFTRYESIRDTEYSHPDLGNFQYKCGMDIFNNHILRGDGFFAIKKDSDNFNKNVFNTIEDYLIYSNGSIARHDRETPTNGNPTKTKEELRTHLYNHSNLLSFQNTLTYRLKEENGWLGFYNKSYVNETNHRISKFGVNTDIVINKVINNRNACDFIDMYPDRSLFSLLPTINENYNDREEYNWDWVITYPYKKRYTKDDGSAYDFFDKDKGLKVIWHMTESLTMEGSDYDFLKKPNGDSLITRENHSVFFRTKMKHGLEIGHTIRIIADGKNECRCRIVGVGDINGMLPEYYFSVSYDDLATGWGEEKTYVLNNSMDTIRIPQNIFISKVVNGVVCEYYIRDFKIIENLKSDIQKAGFAKTVYGDQIGQIIYSNNLDISDLKDHMNRELTEIYLTLVKRNKGYKEWYLSGVTHPIYVEKSHCFGEVTSGFEFEIDDREMFDFDVVKDYNVRMLYNINGDANNIKDMGIPFTMPETLENNISVENNNVFCGDFIEFSPSSLTERVLSEVQHRFNTAQREIINPSYIFNLKKFQYDEIKYDDYDFLDGGMKIANFKIEVRQGMDENNNENKWNSFYPEGYFYKPHHKLKLKEMSNMISYDFDMQMAIVKNGDGSKIQKNQDGLRYEIILSGSYSLLTNDKIIILYKNKQYIEGVINEVVGNKIIFSSSENIKDLNPWRVFLKNKNIPSYAYYSADGSGKRTWRNILLESEIDQDSDIYDRPFANGAIYLHGDVNFFVRRQDPDGRYGLQYTYERVGDYANFTISGNKKDMPDVDYKTIESNTQCEL